MKSIKQPRRKFLQFGTTGIVAAFFGILPKFSFAKSSFNDDKGIVVRAEEGTHILTGRRKVPINIKISKAKMGSMLFRFLLKI